VALFRIYCGFEGHPRDEHSQYGHMNIKFTTIPQATRVGGRKPVPDIKVLCYPARLRFRQRFYLTPQLAPQAATGVCGFCAASARRAALSLKGRFAGGIVPKSQLCESRDYQPYTV